MANKANTGQGNKGRIIWVIYLLLVHLTAGYLLYEKFVKTTSPEMAQKEQPVIEIPAPIGIPDEKALPTTPSPSPSPTAANIQAGNVNSATNLQTNTNLVNQPAINQPAVAPPAAQPGQLLIPVTGVKKSELQDTFNDGRSEGRVHNAIDIMAKGGTPVVAAADGEIAKFFDSKLGGITIYQYSVDKTRIYYYAHLQKRADNLSEHAFVKQGTVIAYVGDTGNAGPGNYHLHFGISLLNDPKRYWEGTDVNPFPLLKEGLESH